VNNTTVAIGDAPPFVPATPTALDTTTAAAASDTAQSSSAGVPSFSFSGIDQLTSQMYAIPGSPAEDALAGSVPGQMQTVLKMMQLLSQMFSIRQTAQPEAPGKMSVSK
jgi:hypothetical protein